VLFVYFVQHCFICRLSDITVWEDAGIEPRTVATFALAVMQTLYPLGEISSTGSYTWIGHGLHGLTEPDSGSNRSALPESSKPIVPVSD
jgi:hypothetical protein